MTNMELYEKLRMVPEEAKKEITAGRLKGFTDINPMWRIKALTEVFGPCGIGWWYVIKDERLEAGAPNEIRAFVDIDLFYKVDGETSQPVPGTGGASFTTVERNGVYVSDECFKMALTDAISTAAKALGVAADVYYAKDRDKYTAPEAEPEKKPEKKDEPFVGICSRCGKSITGYKGKTTSQTAQQVLDGSLLKFGRPLCAECIKAVNKEMVEKAEREQAADYALAPA